MSVIVVAAGVLSALALRRRRLRPSRPSAAGRPAGPSELRSRAREAEEGGRWTEAYRLYFAAGLVELQRSGRLPSGSSVTVGQARRSVSVGAFDRAADRFEAAVYGGGPVGAEDLGLVRAGWSQRTGPETVSR